jgi:hypothetical protein
MAPEGGKVDLVQLKERLARLGVHLDAVPGEKAAQNSDGSSQVQLMQPGPQQQVQQQLMACVCLQVLAQAAAPLLR